MNLKRLKTAESGIKPFFYIIMCCKINTLGFHGTYRIKKEGPVQHGCTGQIMKKMIERFWFLLMISLYRKSVKWICYKFEETVNDEKYPGMMSGQEREV